MKLSSTVAMRKGPLAACVAAVLLLAGCSRASPPEAPPGAAPASDTATAHAGDSASDARHPDAHGVEAAAAVVRVYYDAIGDRDYRRAYDCWGEGGARSGQAFEAFRDGFPETARVRAEVGPPGRIEGAAGSRYVEVPVSLRAVTTDGGVQRFEGAYTLRRTVVEGATPAQRSWRLYDADVARVG